MLSVILNTNSSAKSIGPRKTDIFVVFAGGSPMALIDCVGKL